jgi:Na+/proline symporter
MGIFLCVGVAIALLPEAVGLRDALRVAQAAGRLNAIDTSPSLTRPYTLWGGLVGGLFLMLSYFGCDQSQVQRYLSGKSLTQSRLSLLFNAFLKVPMQFLILLTGVLVFVFYHFQAPPLLWNRAELAKLERSAEAGSLPELRERFLRAHASRRAAAESLARSPEGPDEAALARYGAASAEFDSVRADARALMERVNQGARYNDTNYIFPTYVLTFLPAGLTGLVVAVIFAAAMSSLSGELNALASASMVDFYKRFLRPGRDDARDLLVSRTMTAFWGVVACLVALQAGRLGSAIEVVNLLGSYFYGSILGVFALAVLAPRVGGRGAFYGLMVGMGCVALVSRLTAVHFLWYNVVGALAVFLTGLALDGWRRARA